MLNESHKSNVVRSREIGSEIGRTLQSLRKTRNGGRHGGRRKSNVDTRILTALLRRLADSILVNVNDIETQLLVCKDADTRRHVGPAILALQQDCDAVRYQGLGVNFETDDLAAAIAAAHKRRASR